MYDRRMIFGFSCRERESREDQSRLKSIARVYDFCAFDHALTKHTLHESDKLGASCGAYLAKFPDMTHLNLSYSGFKARAETYPVFFLLTFWL